MKCVFVSTLVFLFAVAPTTVSAQDTASTKRLSAVDKVTLNWFNSPNPLRFYRPVAPTLNASRADMGVEPRCPMPRLVPDTSRVTPMPRARVDTTDSKMRAEIHCGR